MINLIQKIYTNAKRPVEVVLGGIDFIRLMQKKEDTHFLVLPCALGDSLIALAYLQEYKKQKGFSHITVVACPYIQEICNCYTGVIDCIIYIKRKRIKNMQKFARTFIGQHMCTYRYRKRVTFAYWICNLSRRLIKKNNTFTMSGYIKNLLYQIGENANIQLPNIPEIDISYFIERYNLKDKKTVFLNPYAISVSLDVSQLFEHLAEKLANNGYKVITLTANQNQKAIKGTQALTCTLIEAFHLINSYGCVVALRSGFLDLMAFTNAKIICINDAEYEDKYFWNIEQYGVNYDCHTIEYNGNEEMAIQQILAVLSTKC